ncbi:MAG TPA: fluoride efflux transporter CrcB [Burkholderiales bacterium]|nr:fluoride efflux transporter CrcB [Burkholderiales bacterium]
MNTVGLIAVGAGAMFGAWLRWALSLGLNLVLPNLPLGTLTANLAGGFLIGVAVELFTLHPMMAPELRLFVITGFLGGLTTFSTFSAEAVGLLQRGQYAWALGLIGAHLLGSLAMTLLGIAVVRFFIE